jgi:Spy/CpxP family protein refolding chaperone
MKIVWRGVTGILAVLIIGVALGITIDRAILAHSHAASHRDHESEESLLVQRLRSDLDLTDAQLREVESILVQQQATVDSAWLNVRGHLHNSVDSVRSAIERVLTPEQRRGFGDWWDQLNVGGVGGSGTGGNHN